MRWLRRLVLLALAMAAILLSASNNAPVVLRLVPDGSPLGPLPTLTVPLFAVVLASLFLGLATGALLEWLRAQSARRRVARERREQA